MVQKPKSKNKYDRSSLVPAVDQAIKLIEYLGSIGRGRANLTKICTDTGIAKSRVYALLGTLEKHQLIVKDLDTKLYSLGLGFLSFAQLVFDSIGGSEEVKFLLWEVARETGCTAAFGIIENDKLVIAAQTESLAELSLPIRRGTIYELSYGAHGRVILASLPEAEREAILHKEKPFHEGDAAFIDRTELFRELDFCRREKYYPFVTVLNPKERVIASSVVRSDGYPVGALLIFGIFPESVVPKYGPIVVEAAAKLSVVCRFRGDPRVKDPHRL